MNREWVQWRPQKESRDWGIFHLRGDGKGCGFSAWRREAQGNVKQKDRLISVVPWDNLHQLKHMLFCLNIKSHLLTVRVDEHTNRFLREVVVSLSVEISKTWLNTVLGNFLYMKILLFGKRVAEIISRSTFWLQPFCDSVIWFFSFPFHPPYYLYHCSFLSTSRRYHKPGGRMFMPSLMSSHFSVRLKIILWGDRVTVYMVHVIPLGFCICHCRVTQLHEEGWSMPLLEP